MNVFYVSLFGHREICDVRYLDDTLKPIINELILTKPYVSFLVGRNGAFDEYAASIIKGAQRELGKENNDITLVLPYKLADIEYYGQYYDSVVIPESTCGVHPKSAITLKNRWVVERSDLVIVFVGRNSGGAYAAMKYAQRLNRKVINICEN